MGMWSGGVGVNAKTMRQALPAVNGGKLGAHEGPDRSRPGVWRAWIEVVCSDDS